MRHIKEYREFLNEKKPYHASKIMVFDLDDTLVITDAKIKVYDKLTGDSYSLTPEEFNEQPMFDDCWEEIGFKEVKVEEMQKGDALLMAIDSNKLNHVGVYIGDQMVLHHLRGRLSSRDLLGEWLLKCTGKVLRYDA